MEKKRILTIGGTGIVGTPLLKLAQEYGHEVFDISLNEAPIGVNHFHLNRRDEDEMRKVIKDISKQKPLDLVVDICAYDKKDIKILEKSLETSTKHLMLLSTTLVYDRSNISFTNPVQIYYTKFAKNGVNGGYADRKIEIERYLKDCIIKHSILRPYHILGEGSLLGCIPGHNRDPLLINKIKSDISLDLADGGRIPINVVHPKDIARFILEASNNPKTFGRSYNLVNPSEVLARDYYLEVGRQLGKKVKINAVPAEHYWDSPEGWNLTLLPHVYDVTPLRKHVGYVPYLPLYSCIRDALKGLKETEVNKSNIPIHKHMNQLPLPERNRYYTENPPIPKIDKLKLEDYDRYY